MTLAAMYVIIMLLFIPGLQLMDPNAASTDSESEIEERAASPEIPVIQAVITSYPPNPTGACLPSITDPIIPAGKPKSLINQIYAAIP